MTAYYNEIDPFAVRWLKNLISEGLIAPGDVDERSISEVRPSDLKGYTQCHFFAGIGVWSYALRQAGWRDDQEVWTGSCPCQPFSNAGSRDGTSDKRHLWPDFHWLIKICKPPVILGEQVASKDGLSWFDLVQADLEGAGYASGGVDTCAAGFGAPHTRQRLYWMAHTLSKGREGGLQGREDTEREVQHGRPRRDSTASYWEECEWREFKDSRRRPVEPGTSPLVNGTPARVGRVRCYGNALVAPQAQGFVEVVKEILSEFEYTSGTEGLDV